MPVIQEVRRWVSDGFEVFKQHVTSFYYYGEGTSHEQINLLIRMTQETN